MQFEGSTSQPQHGSPAASPGEPLAISWRQPRGLVGLSVVNFLLRVLTLGIYHFWGKTEVRRRIWSAVRLNGEPLEYTGTGRELFIGFLVVFGVVVLPALLSSVAIVLLAGPQSPLLGIWNMVLYGGFFFLAGVGMYRAQRYRLNRTRWRGIRGGLDDESWGYGWLYVWTALLIPMTLGWIIPWRATKLQGFITSRTKFGSEPLRFDARADPLYGRFAGFWIGAAVIIVLAVGSVSGVIAYLAQSGQIAPGRPPSPAVVLGIIAVASVALLLYSIISAWYRAGQINHFAAHTHLQSASFRGNATAASLIWLAVSNFLILVAGFLTLLLVLGGSAGLIAFALHSSGVPPERLSAPSAIPGIIGLIAAAGLTLFSPIVQARSARYLAQRLTLVGHVDVGAIAQGADAGITRGEGLAQAFDIDAF